MTKTSRHAARRTPGKWSALAAAIALSVGGAAATVHAQTEGQFALEIVPHSIVRPAPAPAEPSFEAQFDAAFAESDDHEAQAEQIGSGTASWYGAQFKGRRTASGETFNPSDYTAAHRTLPFGSRVLVTNERTGRSVVVRINDRGPYAHARVIDVSQAAAGDLGLIGPGHAKVSLALLSE